MDVKTELEQKYFENYVIGTDEAWYLEATNGIKFKTEADCQLDRSLYIAVGYQNDKDERIGKRNLNEVKELILKA